jgi:CheY-like chemotaxis protein
MDKKIYNIEVIGTGLALLYAVSCLIFINYLNIPEYKLRMIFYFSFFGLLCVGSVAVIKLKEWGRKLLIAMSSVMLVSLFIRFIPQVDLVPLGYLFLNIIVLLYFTQSKIKAQFHNGQYGAWKKSILIIDDDEVVVKIVRPVLLSHGYSVLAAQTGEDGLQIVQNQKPDLVLLDVILPGIKGREVCRKIKADPATKHIPVIFFTAKDSPDDIKAEEEAGAIGHLTKPVQPAILLDKVQSVFGSKE